MLRVFHAVSGKQLASREEPCSIEALKRGIQPQLEPELQGSRQVLLREGRRLRDDEVMDSAADLELVLLPPFRAFSSEEGRLLLEAAREGRSKEANELLEYGVDPDIQLKHSQSALRLAAAAGHLEIVDMLLYHGADVNATSQAMVKARGTALHAASELGHVEVVRKLLSYAADANRKAQRGNHEHVTPFLLAVKQEHLEVVDLLLHARANIEEEDAFKRTPLLIAADSGNVNVVIMLLEMAGDLHKATFWGKTALHLAAENGHGNVMRMLLEARADINLMTRGCAQTPLDLASENGHTEIVRMLGAWETDGRGDESGLPKPKTLSFKSQSF